MDTERLADDAHYLSHMAEALQGRGCDVNTAFIVSALWGLRRSVDCLERTVDKAAAKVGDAAARLGDAAATLSDAAWTVDDAAAAVGYAAWTGDDAAAAVGDAAAQMHRIADDRTPQDRTAQRDRLLDNGYPPLPAKEKAGSSPALQLVEYDPTTGQNIFKPGPLTRN